MAIETPTPLHARRIQGSRSHYAAQHNLSPAAARADELRIRMGGSEAERQHYVVILTQSGFDQVEAAPLGDAIARDLRGRAPRPNAQVPFYDPRLAALDTSDFARFFIAFGVDPVTAQAAAELLTQLITAAQFYQPFYESIGGQGPVDFDRLGQFYQRQAPARPAPARAARPRVAPAPIAAQAQQAAVTRKADKAQATRDAVALHQAMDGWGTDEAALTRILSNKSNAQIAEIKAAYQEMYGESLEDAIKGDTSGDFEASLLAQLNRSEDAPAAAPARPRPNLQAELAARRSAGRLQGGMTAGGAPRVDKNKATRDAVALHQAMDGMGTDEQSLINLLSNRTNREIRAIKTAYQEMFGESLDDRIKSETSGDLETMLLKLSSGNRDESGTVDSAQATRDAVALHQAIDGWGTDEAALIRLLGGRSKAQIAAAASAYESMYGESLQDAIKGDTSGWFETSLLAQLR